MRQQLLLSVLAQVQAQDLFLGKDACTFTLIADTSCTSTAYKWTNETSVADCCATCTAEDDCQSFEWWDETVKDKKAGNCHLKTAVAPGHRAQKGSTCGLAQAPPTPTPPPPPPPAAKGSPNIIWFLTDDQDVVLGGSFPQVDDVGPMPKTKALMQEQGAMAENWFIHTPICCPSRSELVTGRYYHNLKKTGGGCMHIDENQVNNQTFALYLKEAGYTVGMFGKYLNQNPKEPPAGIDAYMTNGGGNYYQPQFDTQGVSDLAPYNMPDGGWTGAKDDYTTAVVGNISLSWIRKVAKEDHPFFAYIAPKAAHEPFTPASWYADYWAPEWPAHEPRPESWNCSADSRKNHHGNIATQPMISDECADYVTKSFKDRWRTLMSVDDVIESVISLVEELGIADNTYFMYSSDHGFQLGEFNILIDKRQMYDYDIRIHLLMRGPGIKAGSTFPFLGTNVDIAPTWLGMAGLSRPASMDGRSILPLLIDGSDADVPEQTRNHINQLAPKGRDSFTSNWRDSVFIEYYFNAENAKCNGYKTEDIHNNFIGIRHMSDSEFGDTSYTEYQTGNQGNTDIGFDAVDFVEYFNLGEDPWQMKNLWNAGDNATQSKLHAKLRTWFSCRGDSCL